MSANEVGRRKKQKRGPLATRDEQSGGLVRVSEGWQLNEQDWGCQMYRIIPACSSKLSSSVEHWLRSVAGPGAPALVDCNAASTLTAQPSTLIRTASAAARLQFCLKVEVPRGARAARWPS